MEHLAQISIFLFLKQLNQIISATIKNLEMIDLCIYTYISHILYTHPDTEKTHIINRILEKH